MKAVSKKQILLSTIGILIALFSYLFVYNIYMEKSFVLENETKQHELKLVELKSLEHNMAFYQEEIDRMNTEISQFDEKFPSDIKTEDGILLAKEMEDDTFSLRISSISMEASEEVGLEEDSNNGLNSDPALFKTPVSYNYNVSYYGLKNILRFIDKKDNAMSLDSLSIYFDPSTKELSGNMRIHMYHK